jgi:hypothetical protein
VLLGVLDVLGGCRASAHVSVFSNIEAGEVCTEGGKHDIFVVVAGAIVAFEGRGEGALQGGANCGGVSIQSGDRIVSICRVLLLTGF